MNVNLNLKYFFNENLYNKNNIKLILTSRLKIWNSEFKRAKCGIGNKFEILRPFQPWHQHCDNNDIKTVIPQSRAIQRPSQPNPSAAVNWSRLVADQTDFFGGWRLVCSFKTQVWQVGCRFSFSKIIWSGQPTQFSAIFGRSDKI